YAHFTKAKKRSPGQCPGLPSDRSSNRLLLLAAAMVAVAVVVVSTATTAVVTVAALIIVVVVVIAATAATVGITAGKRTAFHFVFVRQRFLVVGARGVHDFVHAEAEVNVRVRRVQERRDGVEH